mmetsp:Transcript_79880/g.222452  ORF Transcript_79880/g.222452 Transcript_79880/m.222452 type:complete len:644 (-) Transcript_79880:4-1935(-)
MSAKENSPPTVRLASSDRDVFGGVTVGQMLWFGAGHLGTSLRRSDALSDLAQALTISGQTAVAVSDSNGDVVGLLTEHDVMRAYFEGVSPGQSIDGWLSSGAARAPAPLLPRLTVRPSAPLAEVAAKMVANAIAGDCACHHAVVQEGGQLYGVLSSLDMVKSLCLPEMLEHQQFVHEDSHPFLELLLGPTRDAVEVAARMTIQEVMTPTENVFTCKPTDTMKDVLKILLMTQQSSALVVDEGHVYGIVTPRDAVVAFLHAVGSNVSLVEWLGRFPTEVGHRVIACDSGLIEAATIMTARNLDSLVVVRPGTFQAVGVVTSLDFVLRTTVRAPPLRSIPPRGGPKVGELLVQPVLCKKGTTLQAAAKMLASSGRTSAIVLSDDDGPPLGLLTEDDIVRAFVFFRPWDIPVESLLAANNIQSPVSPLHLMVRPCVPLTDAASFMLCAGDSRRACHHLVVLDTSGEWRGIFSALDFARAFSQLGEAVEGLDQMTVAIAMKPCGIVPTCKSADSIRAALRAMLISGQNAVWAIDERGKHDLVTSRCALQALADGIHQDQTVDRWQKLRGCRDGPREVAADMRLLEAAAVMSENSLHHLVVVESPGAAPVGVLSSLDLVRGLASIGSHSPIASLAWLRRLREYRSSAL